MAQHQTLPSMRDWENRDRQRGEDEVEKDHHRSGVSTPDTAFPPTPGGSPPHSHLPGTGATGGNNGHLQGLKIVNGQQEHHPQSSHEAGAPSYYHNPYGAPASYSNYPLPSMHHPQQQAQHPSYRPSSTGPHQAYASYRYPQTLPPLSGPRMSHSIPPPPPISGSNGVYYGAPPHGSSYAHPSNQNLSQQPPHLQNPNQSRPYNYPPMSNDSGSNKPGASPPPGRELPPMGGSPMGMSSNGSNGAYQNYDLNSSYPMKSAGHPHPLMNGAGPSHPGYSQQAGGGQPSSERKRSREWEEEGEEGESASGEGSGDEEWREGSEKSGGKAKPAAKAKKTSQKKTIRPSLEDLAAGRETGKKPEKKFICPHNACGRAFARNFNLQSHIKSHLGVRDFKCPECPKSFSRRHDCTRHCIAVHHYDKDTGKKIVESEEQ